MKINSFGILSRQERASDSSQNLTFHFSQKGGKREGEKTATYEFFSGLFFPHLFLRKFGNYWFMDNRNACNIHKRTRHLERTNGLSTILKPDNSPTDNSPT